MASALFTRLFPRAGNKSSGRVCWSSFFQTGWYRQSSKSEVCLCNCKSLHTSSSQQKKRKTSEERKAHRIIQYPPKSKLPCVDVWKNMTVAELAAALGKHTDHVFEVMMYVDNSVSYRKPNSVIDDWQVIKDVVSKSGMRIRAVAAPGTNQEVMKDRDVKRRPPPDPSVLKPRPPVVTIMGHVDHGKTTLLDALRHTSVVDSEFGGITQHIGAFSVRLDSGDIVTFLDTPGHAAFKAMRARGAQITDIVVLVVAADDGVMEQTLESIRMAKEADVPIIVAINKIDKPQVDTSAVKEALLSAGVQVEDLGGEVQVVEVSALKRINLPLLVEVINLQAQLLDLCADTSGPVEGVVVEARTDPHRGKLSTMIVQRGTLRKGAILVAGYAFAKVRGLFDEHGQPIQTALPATPVEILGWRELPCAGDEVLEVETERRGKEALRYRESQKMKEKQEADQEVVEAKIKEHLKDYHAQLEHKRLQGRLRSRPTGPRQKEIQDDVGPAVNVIIKGDVDGSVEAILDALDTYDLDSECKLNVVHYGVGNATESDMTLADTFGAIIYCFNVDVGNIVDLSQYPNVSVKHYNIIYKLIDDLKEQISSRLPLMDIEEVIGEADVLQEFEVSEGRWKVPVAGCRCTQGVLKKSATFRVMRGQEALYEGPLKSMRHLKADVEAVKKGVECGLQLSDPTVHVKHGDVIQCFQIRQESQKTTWDPGF